MADIRSVTEAFAVSPQLTSADLPELAGRFRLVINNRPDGEETGQPCGEEIEAAARAAGLDYRAIPISGPPGDAEVMAVRAALEAADGPVLAYCRSGMRCIVAWSVAEAQAGRPIDEVRGLAAAAGYDVAGPLQALLSRS